VAQLIGEEPRILIVPKPQSLPLKLLLQLYFYVRNTVLSNGAGGGGGAPVPQPPMGSDIRHGNERQTHHQAKEPDNLDARSASGTASTIGQPSPPQVSSRKKKK
jgi:hypothetical protein